MVKDNRDEIKNIISLLRYIDLQVFDANGNHLYLSLNTNFWRAHIKAYWRILWCKIKKRNLHLKGLSLFIWIKLIPLMMILWFVFFFAILMGFDLVGEGENTLKVMCMPHTLFLVLCYLKLSTLMVRKYIKKIEWNINVLETFLKENKHNKKRVKR